MAVRRHIDQALVVQTAIALADANGFEAVTLAAVAEQLGIRIPSLYNHVSGLPGLRYQMSLWMLRELAEQMRRAAVGRAGGDALMGMADAYRALAHAHPGIYRASLRAASPHEPELTAAANELLDLLFVTLRPYNLNTEDMLHTIRALRSVLHGFVDLETSGGFAMSLDLDESFHRLMRAFISAIQASAEA
ncbi:MAG TPA: TetR-like C-terminal domain-containing protein [Phototrophicaceae bacterium]|nr:TetR-like C-terminal domain-containing protein [Phototrophicaceae bacterium]